MQTTNKRKLFTKGPYLMDGGMETTLIFHEGIELNHFASFELINTEEGRQTLKNYFRPYLETADQYNLDFILEAPTWRANKDWGHRMGYSQDDLDQINRDSIAFMRECAETHKDINTIISGCIGPRGDGYETGQMMTANEALVYHRKQVQTLTLADADLISAYTLTYKEEGLGIVLAAKEVNIPVVISFTLETDGRLPSGESLKEVIEQIDSATDNYPEHFMINCAHPEHFKDILSEDGAWKERIKGIRANASKKSHAELDESVELDIGDMDGLATEYLQLKDLLPNLLCYAGCCGTDHRHIGKICETVFQK